ncbi:MAG TPA: murein biosynthesis integral membrane protein MurJ, partial [Anaerolineae bacterium]|nr:murein biosynthesis integral membrane protein MurJ [Anaerolineae bacterium]
GQTVKGDATTEAGRGIAGAAGIIALGNVVSRILGLVRVTVIADLFGATGLVSAYQIAATVPTMIYDLLIGGMLSSALVPVFSEYAAARTQEELWRIVSVVLSLTAVGLGLFAVVLELLAPQVAWLLGGGLEAELQAVATTSIRIVVPAVLLLGLSGVVTGLLYTLKCFTYPAFGAAVFNVGIILGALLLSRPLGIYSLVIGTVLGAGLQLAIQLPGLKGSLFTRLSFSFDLSHPGLRRIALLYAPIVLGLVISQVQVAIDRNLASRTGEQSIAWMQNATNLIQFPHGLVAVAISLAVLPSLSQLSATADWIGYRRTLAMGLRMVVVLILPATVGLFIMAKPIIALIFEHGAFTAYDTTWTALALRCYLLGLVFAAVDWPLNYAFYARQDTLTPASVGVLSVFVYLMVALPLMKPLGMIGLVLADSAKHSAHALTMLVLLHRRVGSLRGHGMGATTFKAALASAVMGALTHWTMTWLQGLVNGGKLWSKLVVVGGAGLTGLIVYGVLI